jgi:hypothetical protein
VPLDIEGVLAVLPVVEDEVCAKAVADRPRHSAAAMARMFFVMFPVPV